MLCPGLGRPGGLLPILSQSKGKDTGTTGSISESPLFWAATGRLRKSEEPEPIPAPHIQERLQALWLQTQFFLHIVLITIPLRVIVMRQLAMSAVKHHYWFPSGLIIQVISNRIIRMLLSELCTSPQGCGSAFDFSGSESSYFSQCASGTAYSRFLNADPPASILCKNTPFQFKNKCGSSVAEPPLF